MNQLPAIRASKPVGSVRAAMAVPATIAAAGDHAARRFLEFFAATIRNKNTRMAYYRAVTEFFAWVERHKIGQLVEFGPAPRPRLCRDAASHGRQADRQAAPRRHTHVLR